LKESPRLQRIASGKDCDQQQLRKQYRSAATFQVAISQAIRKGSSNSMWKPNQPGTTPSTPEPVRPSTPASPSFEAPSTPARPATPGTAAAAAPSGDQATIGKSLVIKGELSGSESLYIDGKVEGAITLPGNRVTVGRNGQVAANIIAREVVVLGKVRGNVQASDRVDIRSEGSLTGDVIAARISIEDGAFFKGGIDIRKPGTADSKSAAAVAEPVAVTA
jgi:cytoskeletal protein CcmA (bactofilin family)